MGLRLGAVGMSFIEREKEEGRFTVAFTPAAGNLPKAPELVQVCSFLTRV